jgi:2-dehydro-3-deoxygalactonokinase
MTRFEDFIAVDWGTSSLRAWRFDAGGAIAEARRSDQGLMQVPPEAGREGFARVLRGAVGDWLGASSRILMCGMVGSRQGWVEAPYVAIEPGEPAGVAELAGALAEVPFDVPCRIVPGLSIRGHGAPDVLRGEETQLAGLPETGAHLDILPGTHSKWVWREDGRVVWFRTFMTGELFDLLGHRSILARSMTGDALDAVGFEQGLLAARAGGGLLEKLFGVRARWLAGELDASAQRGFLSGLLIGTECADGVAAVLREAGVPESALHRAHLVASAALAGGYRLALDAHGIEAVTVDESIGARGLLRIAAQAGWLPQPPVAAAGKTAAGGERGPRLTPEGDRDA